MRQNQPCLELGLAEGMSSAKTQRRGSWPLMTLGGASAAGEEPGRHLSWLCLSQAQSCLLRCPEKGPFQRPEVAVSRRVSKLLGPGGCAYWLPVWKAVIIHVFSGGPGNL